MSVQFCIAVFDGRELLLLAQTEGEEIPEKDTDIHVDFGNSNTVFITGAWGKDGVENRAFFFHVRKNSRLAELEKIPVLECQITCEDTD